MPPTPKRRRRRRNLIVVLAVLVAGLAWFGYRTFHKAVPIINVQVEKVVRRDLVETVLANGRIVPTTQVMISPEVAGEIIELPVKEGQQVKKGDLLVQIKRENYQASANSAEASYQSALAAHRQAEAELEKATVEWKRNADLLKSKLIAENIFNDFQTAYAVAQFRLQSAKHGADQARFALDRSNDDLSKTTIVSPLDGTVTNLKSQLGERVLGTSFNMGTEMMTIARLDEMEARVDIGEIDIVLIKEGQKVRITVDSFKDRKFTGKVSAIANAVKGSSQSAQMASSSQQQEAPKFEVKIRIEDHEAFRPGMSVSAEIETRSRQGALSVPIQSVTTRLPKASPPAVGASPAAATPAKEKSKPGDAGSKPQEVVFALEGDHVKLLPVKTGISDSDYFEIVEGLGEGQQIVSGGYKAIAKDLEDGTKVRVGPDAPSFPGLSKETKP